MSVSCSRSPLAERYCVRPAREASTKADGIPPTTTLPLSLRKFMSARLYCLRPVSAIVGWVCPAGVNWVRQLRSNT